MSLIVFRIKAFIKYLWKSKNLHGIHSPFVYNFTKKCIYEKTNHKEYQQVETIRKQLFKNHQEINICDFGAGSNINKNKKRKISDIAKNSAKTNKFGRLLFRISHYFNFNTGIELGTSLGISALYIAAANTTMHLHTIEGCCDTLEVAKLNFKQRNINNIISYNSDFDTALDQLLSSLKTVDFVFIDGNHRKEPTLKYFHQLLPHLHNNSVIIFDDIHWSPGMEEAWEEIKSHKNATATIDLFELGIVFFRKELTKEDFIIRY